LDRLQLASRFVILTHSISLYEPDRAKSGEKGAARRAEQILNNMIAQFDATGDADAKPNVHTSNAVCNVSFLDHLVIVCSTISTLTLVFLPGLCIFEIRRRSRRGTADCLSSL
jgi:hypothetical protein